MTDSTMARDKTMQELTRVIAVSHLEQRTLICLAVP